VQPPDELMVQGFLPAMRQLVARQLGEQGFSQNKISVMLGITQASVSLYASSDIDRSYSALAQFGVTREESDRYASLLSEDVKASAIDGVATLSSIWTRLLGKGAVCPAHRSQYPSLADCDVCIKVYGERKSVSSDAISEVADAVRSLESSPTFANVMPEVSVNIACVAGSAESPADVVAVPGRIVKVRGRARAMLPPESGASRHLSNVLLIVKKSRPDIRACMNIRYDKKVGQILKRLRLRTIEIRDYALSGKEDPTADALRLRLGSHSGAFDAIVDGGGNGIEPNTYLFAKGARDVAALALNISRLYSAN
jgi:predicted fused transcriptional regulator/phosphomethylpyrimidine kinase/predicted transcriptional regulator